MTKDTLSYLFFNIAEALTIILFVWAFLVYENSIINYAISMLLVSIIYFLVEIFLIRDALNTKIDKRIFFLIYERNPFNTIQYIRINK